MSVKQLTIFSENKKGALSSVTELLTANGIDMRALVVADTPDYGIFRLIVSEPERAREILLENGVMASVVGITIVRMRNVPGGLSHILKLLDDAGVSIEYMYAFVGVSGSEAFAAMRFSDKDTALRALAENGIPLVSENSLF